MEKRAEEKNGIKMKKRAHAPPQRLTTETSRVTQSIGRIIHRCCVPLSQTNRTDHRSRPFAPSYQQEHIMQLFSFFLKKMFSFEWNPYLNSLISNANCRLISELFETTITPIDSPLNQLQFSFWVKFDQNGRSTANSAVTDRRQRLIREFQFHEIEFV